MRACVRLICSLLLAAGVWAERPAVSGQALFSELLDQGRFRLSQKAAWSERVQTVGQRLAEACGYALCWQFYLVDDAVPMACAPGDGVVVVSEGLLRLDLSDDELAGLLGHEMAHEMQGHIVQLPCQERVERNQVQLTNLKVERARLARESQRWAALGVSAPEAWDWLLAMDRELGLLQRDRSQLQSVAEHQRQSNHQCEFSADHIGRQYAVLAGYAPEGLATALGKMLRRCPASLTGESFTHPSVSARLRRLHPTRRLFSY